MRTQTPPTSAARELETGARRAGLTAAVLLAALYAMTAASSVTFWDAGEFLAAFHTLGIPHPPGTPLFVLLGRIAVVGLSFLGQVLPGSMLSAACTAVAGGLSALMVARWTARPIVGVAAALAAGSMSTVWLNATETEVYAPSLCLALCALVAADGSTLGAGDGRKRETLLAYLFGLAVALHTSALVASPAAVLLAATDDVATVDLRRLMRLGGVAVAAMGIGTMSLAATIAGLVVACAAAAGRNRPETAMRLRTSAWCLAALATGASAVLVLLVRARLDPAVDQGHPATWATLADVIARRQYVVAGTWPRQAPWWLQVANLGEWADWQVALGLDGRVGPSPWRIPATALFVALGGIGARRLGGSDRRARRATVALGLAGSIGVVAFLNLKAGPSFGWGVLPEGAPREARERDYFFVLAFWTWGLWAGIGAVTLAERVAGRIRADAFASSERFRRGAALAGLALAALPVATNWRAATRRIAPDSLLPRALAVTLLQSAPPNAVLLLAGDNDSYPLWYLQQAERMRRDVTPVTVPLLGAPWYRDELSRRHALLTPGASTRWDGDTATVRTIAAAATRAGRPVVVSSAIPPSMRVALGGTWTRRGTVWRWSGARIAAPSFESDTATTARVAGIVDARLLRPVRAGGDGIAEWAQSLLRCPAAALAAARTQRSASLDAPCK